MQNNPPVNKMIEANKKLRKDWGEVKPYTRIEESKKHKKPKHKERYENND